MRAPAFCSPVPEKGSLPEPAGKAAEAKSSCGGGTAASSVTMTMMRRGYGTSGLERRASPGRSDRGLTLIEITISLLIVALLFMVAIPSIEAVAGVRAREEAGRLSGAIRYLYGHAALTGQTCRLRFDLEEQSYSAQCTQQRFTVTSSKEKSLDGRKLEEEEDRAPDRSTYSVQDELIGSAAALREKVEKQADFSDFSDEEIKPRKMPDGANLAVWTSRQTERYTKGEAFIYFFPQGHTEKARVYVSDDEGDDVYTLIVSPLSGKVKVEFGNLEEPR